MASLIALSPCEGLSLPVSAGSVTLAELQPEAITSVAPFKGQEAAVSAALEAAIGAAFPAPARTTGGGAARVIWSGAGQALVLGPKVAPEGAAVTDQSDAWAVLRIDGAAAEAVLARLVPIDLRASAFGEGSTARTLLGHMGVSVTRVGEAAFDLMVFRSMAKTAVHELQDAMTKVAARG